MSNNKAEFFLVSYTKFLNGRRAVGGGAGERQMPIGEGPRQAPSRFLRSGGNEGHVWWNSV